MMSTYSRYFKIFACLLIFAAALSASTVFAQVLSSKSPSVQDLLNNLRMREVEIQDYKFIISRSFYHPAYSEDEASKIAEAETNHSLEEASAMQAKVSDDMAQKMLLNQLMREDSLSSNELNGNLLFFEGIGITAWKYSICSFNNTSGEREIKSLMKSESFSMPSLDTVDNLLKKEPTHELALKQVLVNYPELSMSSFVEEEKTLGKNIFQPSEEVVVRVREKLPMSRSIEFPFWHEAFLDVAEDSVVSVAQEGEDRYRLSAVFSKENSKRGYQYELLCDSEGNSYEIVYRIDGEVHWKGTYLSFMRVDNNDVRIPQVGLFWRPAYDTNPKTRESTEIHSLLSASVNRGKRLNDMSVSVPKGSQVIDERQNGSRKSKDVLAPVELGPNVTEYVVQD